MILAMTSTDYFVHEQAICDSPNIGPGTKIWEFSHILPGASIGSDCNLSAGVFVENDVRVGDRVTVKSGTQLWDGVRIEDDVFIGPNVTFTNDSFPRSKVVPSQFRETIVRRGASIGGNATLLPGIEVGRGAVIGAGSVVTKNVPDFALVHGNPARIHGYARADKQVNPERIVTGARSSLEFPPVYVAGVRLIRFDSAKDLRGALVAAEIERHVPFPINRIFAVYDVPSLQARGAHAHKKCHQLLVALSGSVNVVVDDGKRAQEFVLDSPEYGIYMPPMIWGTQHSYTEKAILLVAASMPYQDDDYIREYEHFQELVNL